jgi:hypothetical protein
LPQPSYVHIIADNAAPMPAHNIAGGIVASCVLATTASFAVR